MKRERQEKILSLIVKNEIGTQEDLTDELRKAGFQVTQATVSRDLREMKLTKVADSAGKQRYVAFKESTDDLRKKYIRVLQDGYISMDNAQNILVIRTVSGMAMAVAAALDELDFGEIVGLIAGDDTIMCAIRTIDDVAGVMKRIHDILLVSTVGAQLDMLFEK